jgi:hypothetical protein
MIIAIVWIFYKKNELDSQFRLISPHYFWSQEKYISTIVFMYRYRYVVEGSGEDITDGLNQIFTVKQSVIVNNGIWTTNDPPWPPLISDTELIKREYQWGLEYPYWVDPEEEDWDQPTTGLERAEDRRWHVPAREKVILSKLVKGLFFVLIHSARHLTKASFSPSCLTGLPPMFETMRGWYLRPYQKYW